jgi:hypothetical protein
LTETVANLVLGVSNNPLLVALGTAAFGTASIAGTRLLRRATTKFQSSLIMESQRAINAASPYLRRHPPLPSFFDRAVIITGPHRSGKSVFISHSILNNIFPWWSRTLFPPFGFFLQGNSESPNAREWLKTQVSHTAAENPLGAILDHVTKRHTQQRVRILLNRLFPNSLPRFLRPQPSYIIIDQAEELIASYRAKFLNMVYPLVKYARDSPQALQLLFVVNSNAGALSLEALNGGTLFTRLPCPAPTKEEVRAKMSDEFSSVFEALGCQVGTAEDYLKAVPPDQRHSLPPTQWFASVQDRSYRRRNIVAESVSQAELDKAALHEVTAFMQ